MKKVAIIYGGSRAGGGVDTYLTNLFKYAKKDKVTLELISLGEWALTNKFQTLDFKLKIYPGNWWNLWNVIKISFYLKKNGFNLIVSQGMVSNFYGRLASLFSNIPNLVTVHSDYSFDYSSSFKKGIFILADRVLRQKTSHYITVSNHLKSKLVESGINGKIITVIYNGVEGGFVFNKKRSRQILLGTMGRLHPVKNFSNTILALKKINGVKLNIYGEGDQKKYLQNLIKTNGLSNKVKLCGRRSLSEIFSEIDFYIQASYSEGFGIAVVEAMLAEKPVLVTEGGALKELVAEERGFVIDGYSDKDIAKGINRALTERDSWASKSKKAKAFAENSFKIIDWADSTVLTYLKAAK